MISNTSSYEEALPRRLQQVLDLPRQEQPGAVKRLSEDFAERAPAEEWNTLFGPGSLFDAWTSSELLGGLYQANLRTLTRAVTAAPGWRVVEAGGGDGRLWSLLRDSGVDLQPGGELVLVDPSPQVHIQVARCLPEGVRLRSLECLVQDATLPTAELVICSLTLHHVAGRSASERARHGLIGPGKLEVLQAFAESVRPAGGAILLNEADVHCEIDLPSGDPILVDRMIDSYLRRCARALLGEHLRLHDTPDPHARRARLLAIIHRWCVDQVQLAYAPLADRDVYELDVSRWLELFPAAGLHVESRDFTDRFGLFCRYELTAAPR